jgi:hypothetical protein
LDISSGTNFSRAWQNCTGLTSFPSLNTSSGTDFGYAWNSCTNLKCIKGVDTTSQTNTTDMFNNCTNLCRPNSSEQTTIKSGSNWVNDTYCQGNLEATNPIYVGNTKT